MLTVKIRALARRGDADALRKLLDRDPSLIEYPTGAHNRSLLWEAVCHGRKAGRTPLKLAQTNKREGMVALLAEAGAAGQS